MDKNKCGKCGKSEDDDVGGERWLACSNEECEQWFHMNCVGVENADETTTWYCSECFVEQLRANSKDKENGQHPNESSDDDDDDDNDDNNNDDNDDENAQLQAMTTLIKEREELCALKQKQLEMMERMSQKRKSTSVNGWLNDTQHFGGESSRQLKVKAKEGAKLISTNNKVKDIAHVTLRKKNLTANKDVRNDERSKKAVSNSAPCVRSEVSKVNDDLSNLLKRQMLLMNQQYLTELPEFDGDVDVWPIFYQQYLTTSEQGGFDDAFNLIRLRKCLKGEARQAVAGIIALPNCLVDVLVILQKRFGSQDVIVRNKIKKLSNIAPPNESKPHTIKQFYEFLVGFRATLRSVRAANYLESPHTMDTIAEKLPVNMKRQWIRHIKNMDQRPTIDEFLPWFEPFYDCANECDQETSKSEQQTKRGSARVNMNKEPVVATSSAKVSTSTKQCQFCNRAQHTLIECEKFRKSTNGRRWLFVRRRRLCFACLQFNHRYENCEKRQLCKVEGCNEYHHKLLHREAERATVVKEPEVVMATESSSCELNQTLFRSLPVELCNPNTGKKIVTWAFLDEGSSPTMLLDSVADALELEGSRDELCTTWTDDSVRKEENSRRVQLSISGVGQARNFVMKNVRTVSQMNLPVPVARQDLIHRYGHLRDLKMPDIPLDRPAILIGLEHAKMGLMYDIREGKWNEPVATRTRLGWVIHGKQHQEAKDYVCHVCDCGSNNEIENMMRMFSSTESFGVKAIGPLLEAKDTIRANHILQSTTRKLDDGYETGLLWKRDDVKLPDSKRVAQNRLLCFEKRLDRDQQLKAAVQTKMYDHIEKGYMVEISTDCLIDKRHWYLPIFVVQNPHKPSKPRLVFDAAAKSGGVSLNDLLVKGPEMISSLFGIILRFRLKQFAISADIAEMFHRVRMIEEDQLCQLVLWRNCDVRAPVKTYKMTRMTFGATCSPCSAHHVKNENAKKFSLSYPRAVEAIVRNHYVDNLLDCFESEEEALEIAQQIRMIHKEAGFNIRDWVSNSRRVMNEMNMETNGDNLEVNMNMLDEATATERILGMYWKMDEDTFVFKVNVTKVNPQIINKVRPPSKREVLKVIMSQFDPLGILSPLIIYAKILMQDIWSSKIDWDENIPANLVEKWNDWLEALNKVTNLHISRWYFHSYRQTEEKIALHVFTDASEEAFACVAYIVQNRSEDVHVSFVAAKSRVAPGPPKCLSIPRLELQAAVLATRLKCSIVEEIGIKFDDIIFWSDSKTVLGWIRSNKRKYSAFVSHRISEILESSTVYQWRWLQSKRNVADEATRLKQMPEVSSRWLNGPEFLAGGVQCWPEERERVASTDEESIRIEKVHVVKYTDEIVKVARFSKWERLLRCVAYVGRFIRLWRGRRNRQTCQPRTSNLSTDEMIKHIPALTGEELNGAERILYKIVQRDHYAAEYKSLKKGESVAKNSKIFNLNPVLADDGLLRLASRIDVAPAIVEDNLRRPIILSREHRITNLLIDAVHRKFHHVNKECVVNEIRQYIWIPKIRVQVNKIVHNCFYCKYRRAKPRVPRMAPLHEGRLSPFQPAFSYTGVDFFGPVEITVGRHHEKRWGVLFVCLTMRAIHLEIASTLDTNSAIMCVRNFGCRRGPPLELFSDNGTNFRAAEKELRKAVQEIDFERLQNESMMSLPNETRTKWTFIPPGAPHFGGSWERMIQSVKRSLYIILKEKYPKEETLRNALIEVENLINSRPLYYTPNDIDSEVALTPNHLLKGSNRQMVPLPGDIDSRRQWRVAQALAKEFWNRWLYEYLPTISRRPKWQSDVEAVRIGQLVLMVDENLQRGEWKRGIISKVYPSRDGRIRTAEVRTANGTYMRPVAKLAVIDLGEDVRY